MMWRTPVTQAFDDALASRRPATGEVAELVAVATRLCEIAAETAPTPEFRTALRTRLLATPIPAHAHPAHPVRKPAGIGRWAVAFVAMLAATFGVGMTAASASTLPGDTLYPVKRAVETAQLAFRYTDSSRGDFHLRLASERLEEVDQMTTVHGTSTQLTSKTLDEFERQAGLGSDALLRSYLSSDSTSDLKTLHRFSESSSRRVAGLRGRLSADDLAKVEGILDDLTTQSSRMCPDCTGSVASGATGAAGRLAPSTGPTTTSASVDSPASPSAERRVGSTPSESRPTQSTPSTGVSIAPKPEESGSAAKSSPKTPPVADLVDKSVVKPLEQSGLVPGLTGSLLGSANEE